MYDLKVFSFRKQNVSQGRMGTTDALLNSETQKVLKQADVGRSRGSGHAYHWITIVQLT